MVPVVKILTASLRTSELWVSLATLLGQILVVKGVVKQEDWNHFLYPSIVYVISRVTSKIVKAVPGGAANETAQPLPLNSPRGNDPTVVG